MKFRSRHVLRFGQFDGRPCLEPLGDTQSCTTSEVCPEEPEPDCGADFQCNSGRYFFFHAIASYAITQETEQNCEEILSVEALKQNTCTKTEICFSAFLIWDNFLVIPNLPYCCTLKRVSSDRQVGCKATKPKPQQEQCLSSKTSLWVSHYHLYLVEILLL